MAIAIAQGDETELNMTPMIDVVFQLILFFLFSLKFKSIDRRIDSTLPKDRGLAPTATFPPDIQNIKVKLFRKDKADRDNSFTRIRIGNDITVDLPKGYWTERAVDEEKRLAQYDQIFAQIAAHIRNAWDAQNRNPEVKGEISTPLPDGPAVPSGDVVRVLDAFLEVGISGVNFEGTSAPVPTTEGGTMFK
jgi:hypothetical protein